MSTSNTYNFPNILAHNVIRDAYQQINLNPSLITGQQYTLALQSLNMLLDSWISKRGLNLFTVEQDILLMNQGQNIYPLPSNTSKVLESTMVQTQLVIMPAGTTFYNSNYAVSNVFTPPNYGGAGESLSGSDGWYVCFFPVSNIYPIPIINYVGITTVGNPSNYNIVGAQPVNYTLAIQYMIAPDPLSLAGSYYSSDPNWQTVLQTPTMTYLPNVTQWFALPYQINAPYVRIISMDNNDTVLNLYSIQFATAYKTTNMNRVGRDVFTKMLTSSTNQSTPSVYYVNRAKQPTISFYPIPDGNYNFAVYNRVRSIQDVSTGLDALDISPRFIEAATVGLAARLARLYAPDKVPMLAQISESIFAEACSEDTENLPIQITNVGGIAGKSNPVY